jgi:bifunctional isochorismate lyase/aryl carrier protein
MTIPKIADYSLAQAAKLPNNRVDWEVDPDKAVLLIHDMQNYFVDFYGEDSVLVQQLIHQIQQLKRWANSHDVPIVYTAQPGNQCAQERALLTDFWGPGLKASALVTDIVPALTPQTNDIQYTKWRYSAFKRSPLEHYMKTYNRDQLVICGIYAHIGILSTALEGFMLDIKPFVVADAVADFSLEEQQMALNFIAGRCGRVVACQEVVRKPSNGFELEQLKQDIADSLMLDPSLIDVDENLMYLGLDSIRMMTLVDKWQSAGAPINFSDLAESTTLSEWHRIIASKLAQPVKDLEYA